LLLLAWQAKFRAMVGKLAHVLDNSAGFTAEQHRERVYRAVLNLSDSIEFNLQALV
jgi:hypothetical protein